MACIIMKFSSPNLYTIIIVAKIKKVFFKKKKKRVKGFFLTIPDFGVSAAILNPVDIFRRWCKLNFGLLRGHVKSRHITAISLKG